jgi:enterochelin esterase family protein
MGIRLGHILLLLMFVPQVWGQEPRSPQIDRLQATAAKNLQSVEEFWKEVQRRGTPLIDAIADDGSVIVTFLWRGGAELRNVIVFASVLPENDPTKQGLAHIPGTDIWYRSYRFPRDLPILYELSPDGVGKLQRDPLNPRFLDGPMGGSILVLPGVRNMQWSDRRPATQGTLETVPFRSRRLENQRTLRVYLPAGFVRGQGYDLLLMLDEDVYTGPVPLPNILDNLIASGRLRPTVAVLIGNADRQAELSCSSEFAEFLTQDLLPWIDGQYQLQRKREHTTIAGSSLGGLAAAYIGWTQPAAFANVIALSGSFRWRPASEAEPEWFTRQLALSAAVPVRFYVGVGTYETGTPNEPGNPSLLTANRHLRDVLLAKEYDVKYQEFPGAHEPLSWRPAIAEALVAIQRE